MAGIVILLSLPAFGATTAEIGVGARYAPPSTAYDGGVDGGETPPIGVEFGLAFQGASHVGLRLGLGLEGYHARWAESRSGEVLAEGLGSRAEARVALRTVVGDPDRLVGREAGPVGTVDLGVGVAWLGSNDLWMVPGARWAPTLSLRPAIHGAVGRLRPWVALDLRVGAWSDGASPYCAAASCPSVVSHPGGGGIGLVIGTDLLR